MKKEEANELKQTSIMLIKAIIGGAALVFPLCYLRAGLFASSLALILAGWAGVIISDLLMETRKCMGIDAATFREMGVIAFKSERAGFFFDFTVTLQSFGTLVGFVVAVGDLVSITLQRQFNFAAEVEVWGSGGRQSISVRTYALLFSTIFFYFPLCLLRRLDSLRALAAFTMIIYVFFLLVLLNSALEAPAQVREEIEYFTLDLRALFRVLPIIALSYSCVPLMMEMRADVEKKLALSSRLEQIWRRITIQAFAASGLFYILTGLLGYLAFGASTRPNVLQNLQEQVGGWMATTVNFLFAASLVVSYPLITFVVREPFRRFYLHTFGITVPKDGVVPFPVFALEALSVTSCTLAAAIAIPGLDVVLEFIGGTAAVFVNYLAPVLMFLIVRPDSTFRRDLPKALVIGSVGALVSALTLGNLFGFTF